MVHVQGNEHAASEQMVEMVEGVERLGHVDFVGSSRVE